MKLNMCKIDGSVDKEIQLPKLFETEINEHLLYESVKAYLANKRQGNSKTKTRSEVSGGGSKPWRQKGTGRARSGTNTSPVWVRGGKAHGPAPRCYRMNLNKKEKRKALKIALSLKAKEESIKVLDALEIETPKSKKAFEILKNIGVEGRKCLVVLEKSARNVYLACRNLKGVTVKPVDELNPYIILNSEMLVLTEGSLKKISEDVV